MFPQTATTESKSRPSINVTHVAYMETLVRLDPDQCWKAIMARDASFDGQFVFGVITTGVYCRPSCPSRHAHRRHVRFFATPELAEAAGLRPCLRCRPTDQRTIHPLAGKIEALCRFIEDHAEEKLTLHSLSEVSGISPYHLLRSFRAVSGLTPKQYVDACRMKSFKDHLREGKSVTEALYHAGYGSSSRVYEKSSQSLGMTPGEYRGGGSKTSIYYATESTALGNMLVAGTDKGLCSVQFADSREELVQALKTEFPAAALLPLDKPYPESFRKWIQSINEQIDGNTPRRPLPLDINVSAFQQLVYQYLRTIPIGETRSYADVAKGIGQPLAARAVGNACGSNPVAIVVPCHRVVRADGATGEYRWGEERKKKLLDMESTAAKRTRARAQ